MVEAPVVGAAYVHSWAAPAGFHTFENLNVLGSILIRMLLLCHGSKTFRIVLGYQPRVFDRTDKICQVWLFTLLRRWPLSPSISSVLAKPRFGLHGVPRGVI